MSQGRHNVFNFRGAVMKKTTFDMALLFVSDKAII